MPTKLSALPTATAVNSGDLTYIVHAGASEQATFSQVSTYLSATGSYALTGGSYPDPAWITSLSGTKIVGRGKYLAYDDFSAHADGPLGSLLTGQPWIQNTIGQATTIAAVAGGTMGVTTFTSASYPTVDLGAGVEPGIVWASWIFQAAGTTGSAVGLLISPVNPLNLANISSVVHLIYGDQVWQFGIFDGGVLSSIASGNYVTPLPTDGTTVCTGGIKILGSTATLYCPDGTTHTFTDARIGSFNGRYVTFELFIPTGTHNFRYTRTAVESRNPALLPLAHPGIEDLWSVANACAGEAQSRAPLDSPTFTGTVTAPFYATTGAASGYGVNRRDNSVAAWQCYSAAGNLQFYSVVAGVDVMTVSPSGVLTANGSGLTNLNPANLAGTPVTVSGAKAGNAALASLLTALASLHLITDSTT